MQSRQSVNVLNLLVFCAAITSGCTPDGDTDPVDSGVTAVDGGLAIRIAAAKSTAENATACTSIRPFYWEVGDASGTQASGSLTGSGFKTYTADTLIDIASASKWFYSGLGAMNSAALATEVRSQIGTDIGFAYNSPQPAGGGETTAGDALGARDPRGVHQPRHLPSRGQRAFTSRRQLALLHWSLGRRRSAHR